jgi:hypothetical protein
MKISQNDRIHSPRDMDQSEVQKKPAGTQKFEEFLTGATITPEQIPKKIETSHAFATGSGFAGNVGTSGHASDKTPNEPTNGISTTETKPGWAFAQGPGFSGNFGTSGHGNDK